MYFRFQTYPSLNWQTEKYRTIHLENYKKVPRIDTCRNKLLEIKIKSKQVVNNQDKRLIHSALIESLRSGENLTSIARLNGKKYAQF